MKNGVGAAAGWMLVEALITTLVAGFLMLGLFGTATCMFRAGTLGANQTIASNIAQEVIDNARNTSFATLQGYSSVSGTSQTLSLYSFNAGNTFFPRAVLRDNSLTYTSSATTKSVFPGTVTETLTMLAAGGNGTGEIQMKVVVYWSDSSGKHTYTAGTLICEGGINNQ